ncbi:MAG: serine hydrolase domain-containing protein, partial [Gemmatimonas sp.]
IGFYSSRRQPSTPRGVEADLLQLLPLANVPSLSIARVNGDRIATTALGVQRAGESERVTPDTVYAAASLTKAAFAYVLLGLVHDGLLSLDRPVGDYLPLPNPGDTRAAGITARHLLSHSGGWRNWRNSNTQPLTADFEPGSRWSYSGEGYFFLQRIVEKLTNKSIGVLMRERLFEPLRMKRTSMGALAELDVNRAAGHDGRGQASQPFGRAATLELRRLMAERGLSAEAATVDDTEKALRTAEPTLPVLPNFLSNNAAASLLTTAADFALFLRHVVTARQRGGADAAVVALMMSPQVRCNARVQWGLGVGLEDVGTRRYAWQWGDNPGFKNYYFADPTKGTAMVVFTNGDRGARIYERAIRTMTGEDHPGFLWA